MLDFLRKDKKKEEITPNIEADKLVAYAWRFFCKKYPKAIERLSGEDLEDFKAIWNVGYYFSLDPMFSVARKNLEALLPFIGEGSQVNR